MEYTDQELNRAIRKTLIKEKQLKSSKPKSPKRVYLELTSDRNDIPYHEILREIRI